MGTNLRITSASHSSACTEETNADAPITVREPSTGTFCVDRELLSSSKVQCKTATMPRRSVFSTDSCWKDSYRCCCLLRGSAGWTDALKWHLLGSETKRPPAVTLDFTAILAAASRTGHKLSRRYDRDSALACKRECIVEPSPRGRHARVAVRTHSDVTH